MKKTNHITTFFHSAYAMPKYSLDSKNTAQAYYVQWI